MDLPTLYEALQRAGAFTSVIYFRKAAVIRFKYKKRSIMVFGDGRITINSVRNRGEALNILQFLMKALNTKPECSY